MTLAQAKITKCRAGWGVVVPNRYGVAQIVAIYATRKEARRDAAVRVQP